MIVPSERDDAGPHAAGLAAPAGRPAWKCSAGKADRLLRCRIPCTKGFPGHLFSDARDEKKVVAKMNKSFFTVVASMLFCLALTAAAPAETVRIAAVGDVMMGSQGRMPANDGQGLFEEAAPLLKGNDVVFLNHEGTLADRGTSVKPQVKGRSYSFRTPTRYGRYLAEAGFNMASLANNHSFDYNRLGLDDTQDTLRANGIVFSHHSGSIARLNIRGTRVAMAAFWIYSGEVHDLNNIDRAREITARLAAENDVVLISMHGGAEGADRVHTPRQMETFLGEKRGNLPLFAHAVVDAGADMVIGHGPHVPRAMELYKGRLIAYSLGNFCTTGFGTTGALGLAPLLLAEVDGQGRLTGGRVVSFIQTKSAPPRKDPKNRAALLMYDLGEQDFPGVNALDSKGGLVVK